jgi:hypothetical protein
MNAARCGLRLVAVAPLLLLLGGADYMPETPQPDVACKLHHSVREFASLAALPSWFRNFLRHTPGEMADRGGRFNSTDVVIGDYPSRRFIRAGQSAAIWFLWYEQGGIAYSKNILIVRDAHGGPDVIAAKSYFRENPCPLTDALLEQAR